MTEYERNWKEPETYSDYENGCYSVVGAIIVLFVIAVVALILFKWIA